MIVANSMPAVPKNRNTLIVRVLYLSPTSQFVHFLEYCLNFGECWWLNKTWHPPFISRISILCLLEVVYSILIDTRLSSKSGTLERKLYAINITNFTGSLMESTLGKKGKGN